MAIFPHNQGSLRIETKREVYRQYRRGESVQSLAQRFCLLRPGSMESSTRCGPRGLLELPLEHVANEQFARLRSQKKEAELLGPPPEINLPAKKPRLPNGLSPYLASLYEVPLLTREQEIHLFRKMNYLKFKAGKLREKLDVNRPNRILMNQIGKLYDESAATKNHIVRANLRLVVSLAKRYVGAGEEFFELVSDGNMSLMRAVEKFDISRGNKFSTYASWAIMKNFARTIPNTFRYQDRFRTSQSEMFSTVEDARTDYYQQQSAQIRRESQVEGILTRLDARERQIVSSRFGLTRGEEPLTLKQVGAAPGCNERANPTDPVESDEQIENGC